MPKGKRSYELTPEIRQQITAFIRAGAFPHVAAEAAGIPREEFDRWLNLGSPVGKSRRQWQPHRLYTPFWHEVMQARAQARLRAEVQALKEDPIAWLKSGPGKERLNEAGWSVPVKPNTVQNNQINVLLSPEMQGIFSALLQVLSPFPEARAAVALALATAEDGRQSSPPKAIQILEAVPVGRQEVNPPLPPLESG